MHKQLHRLLKEYSMLQPGDTVYCAVSGGADSVAMLWAFYLLKENLSIDLRAAHFNHRLRGAESDRDEAFVRQLCARYDIPLAVGQGQIVSGEKGLEAAARDARYSFFDTLPGKVATAHTADDNTETVLMRLVRGTGLKGLGGIAPVRGKYIRPMLSVTRQEVLAYLREYHLEHITDSSNRTDDFLRNRLRHRVLPLLLEENPSLMENTSYMARQLRFDEEALTPPLPDSDALDIAALRAMDSPRRVRFLTAYLARFGIQDPTSGHIRMLEQLIRSDDPSAYGCFPGGVVISREYGRLVRREAGPPLPELPLPKEGSLQLPGQPLKITCTHAAKLENSANCFTVCPKGKLTVRRRLPGDRIRLHSGTKSLKKLFIDRKIPAALRDRIPVVADEEGVLGVFGIGVNLDRAAAELPATKICIEDTPAIQWEE